MTEWLVVSFDWGCGFANPNLFVPKRSSKVNEAEGVSNNGCGIGFVFYVEGDAFLQTPSGDPGNFFNRGGDEAGNGEFAET